MDLEVKKTDKYKLSEENAKKEFQRLLDFYGIDIDPADDSSPVEMQVLFGLYKDFVKYIRQGLLEIVDLEKSNIGIKQNFVPQIGTDFNVIYQFASMRDTIEKCTDTSNNYGLRMCLFLGSLSRKGSDFFSVEGNFTGVNYRVAEKVNLFFHTIGF